MNISIKKNYFYSFVVVCCRIIFLYLQYCFDLIQIININNTFKIN